jgi:putative membrane protein
MPEAQTDPRVYFASERTFLAWIRTGLALMGIGFAVSRFGLFLREMRVSTPAVHSTGLSLYSGVALVGLGIVVNIAATIYHVRTTAALRSGTWVPGVSRNAIVLALLLAAAGMGMAAFLLILH